MTDDHLKIEADLAADYIEGLLDIADIDGDIEIGVNNGRPLVKVVSENAEALRTLIGDDGEVLLALQELARLSVNEQTNNRTALLIDIDNWRDQRVAELKEVANEAIEQLKSEETVDLKSMNSFERKMIHDIISEAGYYSHSEGEGRTRHIVVTREDTKVEGE
jgi:spoIIIJ-associated protein